jgi:hypothetical protein
MRALAYATTPATTREVVAVPADTTSMFLTTNSCNNDLAYVHTTLNSYSMRMSPKKLTCDSLFWRTSTLKPFLLTVS